GKRWQTRKGRTRGGAPFTKTSLYRLLTNVAYAGKVRYKDEVHPGEQPALIDADTFGRVQALLRCHGPEVGAPSPNRFSSLLKGLLRCVGCDCAMTPAHTTRKGSQRYRYYTCVNAQSRQPTLRGVSAPPERTGSRHAQCQCPGGAHPCRRLPGGQGLRHV